MDETLRDFELEDLHAARRLRIGCPVYGHFYDILKMQYAKALPSSDFVTTAHYNSGYYNPRTGRFSPVPPPAPR